MRYLLKPLHFLYVAYAFALFLVLMVPVFLWALITGVWGRIKGGNLLYAAIKIWADVWFALVFIRHRNLYKQRPQKDQSYIFVVNHTAYLDAALIPKAIRQPVRPLGKIEMAKVPVFGTIYKNAIVTVDRSSAFNRARSVKVLKSILQKGISVLVFPEGTFNETGQPLKEFYDGAFRIAIETGTPIMPVLFLDSYRRMPPHSFLSLNPGRSRALFLPVIAPNGYTVKDVSAYKNKVFSIMAMELEKQNAPWINHLSL